MENKIEVKTVFEEDTYYFLYTFGKISYTDNYYQIDCYFKKINIASLKELNKRNWPTVKFDNYSNIKKTIFIAHLYDYILGSIWQNNICVCLPDKYMSEKSMSIYSSFYTVKSIYSLFETKGKNYIEKVYFNYAGASLLRFPAKYIYKDNEFLNELNKYDAIYIPCTEIIRHFYGSSPEMINKIVSSMGTFEDIYDIEESRVNNEKITNTFSLDSERDKAKDVLVHLSEGLGSLDSIIATHLLTSQKARDSFKELATTITKTISSESFNSNIIAPIPFRRKGTINIYGVEHSINTEKVFFVYYISNNTFNFNFNSWRYLTEHDPRKEKGVDSESLETIEKTKSVIPFEAEINTAVDSSISPSVPSRRLIRNTDFFERFLNKPGFAGKAEKKDQKYTTQNNEVKKIPIERISYNNYAKTDKNTAGISPQDNKYSNEQNDSESYTLDHFINSIQILNQRNISGKKLVINFIKLTNQFYQGNSEHSNEEIINYFPAALYKNKKSRNLCFLEYNNGKWERIRRFIIAEIIIENKHIYFIEIEHRYNKNFPTILMVRRSISLPHIQESIFDLLIRYTITKKLSDWISKNEIDSNQTHNENQNTNDNFQILKLYLYKKIKHSCPKDNEITEYMTSKYLNWIKKILNKVEPHSTNK